VARLDGARRGPCKHGKHLGFVRGEEPYYRLRPLGAANHKFVADGLKTKSGLVGALEQGYSVHAASFSAGATSLLLAGFRSVRTSKPLRLWEKSLFSIRPRSSVWTSRKSA
jgi:hypothetical protein